MRAILGLIICMILFGMIPAIPYFASIIGWYWMLAIGISLMMFFGYLSDKRDYERKLKEVPFPVLE